jgi:cytochrome c553
MRHAILARMIPGALAARPACADDRAAKLFQCASCHGARRTPFSTLDDERIHAGEV